MNELTVQIGPDHRCGVRETGGHLPQAEPRPKADRIAEVAEKLEGVADGTSGETVDHVLAASDHFLEQLRE
ncbi:hypothetical protein [Natrinema soli]|uniref:Uncharacterized protein n=1 Tax=Natrinema soli TaxID=1930624 RepID=A0ABD5SNX5_9EURY|nr:hypothetical protein [Natrinema soli]